jgi:hypothetical protein
MVAKAQTAVNVIPANGIKSTAAETKIKNMGYNPSSLTRQQWADILNLTIYRPGGGQFYADAFPGGSIDPITKEVYTKQETEQKQATYNKEKAKQEIGQIAKEYYNTLYSPFKPAGLTDLGIEKATERFNTLISQLQERASTAGITPSQFKQTFQDALMAKHEFDIKAYEKINADRGGLLGFLDVATPIITQAGAAIITGGLSIPQQLAVNSALSIMKGGDLEDIVKSAVGTLGANEVSQYLSEIKKISEAEPILKNAIVNAGAQGTYAAITGGDVVTNILSGAAGGAVAGATFKATDDKAISAAAGEYSKNLASGMSSKDAMTAALVDFIVSDRVDAERKIKEAANETQPVAVKPGSQLGEPSAGVGDVSLTAPTSISSLPQFKPLSGETADAVVKVTDREGVVTYKRNITQTNPSGETTGYTITYDPEIQEFRYETAVSYKDGLGGVEVISSKTRPGAGAAGTTATEAGSTISLSTQPKVPLTPSTTPEVPVAPTTPEVPVAPTTPTVPSEPRQDTAGPVNGAGNVTVETSGSGNVTRDIIDLTGIGADTGLSQEADKVAKTETVGDQAKTEVEPTEKEPSETEGGEANQGSNLILLGLLGGEGTLPGGSQPTQQQTTAMRALSQALRAGDPGEPLFGSRVGKRKNVWNVESLRIKDELGG